jgi:lysine-specific demethylase 8
MTGIKHKHLTEYQFWRFADHLFGNQVPSNRFINQRKKVTSLITANFKDKKIRGALRPIDRVRNISDLELKKNYIDKGIPVVMVRKAKEWACVKKWSPDWLLENYCDDKVSIFNASTQEMTDVNYSVEETILKDVLNAMKEGDTSKYSRFNRLLYDHPGLIEDFDWKWLYNRRNIISSGKTFQVFIGGKGTRTTLHSASEHNLFTQVYGSKHWYLYPPENDVIFEPPVTRTPYFHSMFDPESPNLEVFPNAKYLQAWECKLEAGDVLFNPPSWWHQVTNLEDSIGVGFRWFSPTDSFKLSFMQTLLTFTSTNPPIWMATKNRTDFARIFKYMNKTKKI